MSHRFAIALILLGECSLAARSGPAQTPAGDGSAPGAAIHWNLTLPPTPGHTGRISASEEGQLHEGPGGVGPSRAPYHFHARDGRTGRLGPGIRLDEKLQPIDDAGMKAPPAAPSPKPGHLPGGPGRDEEGCQIPAEIEEALLAWSWKRVIDLQETAEEGMLSPVMRLILAHAFLALNENDTSLVLFIGASGDAEQRAWSCWTEEFRLGHPDEPSPRYFRADSLARSRKWREALGELQSIRDQRPGGAGAETAGGSLEKALILGMMGAIQSGLEDFDGALLSFLEARSVHPALADAQASFGVRSILISDGPSAANLAFRAACKASRSFTLALNGRGCTEVALGRFEEARKTFEAVALVPECSVLAQRNFTRLAKVKKDWVESEALRVAAVNPGMSLEKLKLAGSLIENQWHAMNNVLGQGLNTGLMGLTGSANTFFKLKPELGLTFSKNGLGFSGGLKLGFNNPGAYQPLHDIMVRHATSSIGRMQTNLMKLDVERREILNKFQTNPGGVDTRVPADPMGGSAWELAAFFGLYYEIIPPGFQGVKEKS